MHYALSSARRRVRPHKPHRHRSAPDQACYHGQLALLWQAHDHILMHVACSRRGYQLRLQSCELALRPRFVSAASRPSPLSQRHMPCFFVFTDRDEAYPSRACRHPSVRCGVAHSKT